MEPVVRNFRLGDLQRVVEIERASFGIDAYDILTFLHLYYSCGDFFLVAELGKEVIGYSITCVERFGSETVGYVHSIAVDPRHRKRGVGRTLMEETFRRLRGRGIRDVILDVSAANEAGLSFWRSLGFSPIGVKKKFYLDGSDAILMRKKI